MTRHDSLDPRLETLLDEIKDVPARDPRAAARARSRFAAQAVSAHDARSHSVWMLFHRKEQFAVNLIVSLLVIAGVLFGSGATVSAARNDLPGEPLYQLKLAGEDASLWMSPNPNARIDRLMEQSQTRLQEMAALASQGTPPPLELATRMQARIGEALRLAAGLPKPDADAALQRIRTRLQEQERELAQLQASSCASCQPALLRTREMLQTQLRLAEDKLASPEPPQEQQHQYQNQNQFGLTQPPEPEAIPPGAQASCTPALDGTGEQYRNGNPDAGTPQPPNDNGSGTGGNGNGDGGNGPGSGSGGESGSGTGAGTGNGTGGGTQGNP